MHIAISDAEPILDELVGRVLAGEEVILTLDGEPVAHLVACADFTSGPKPQLA